MVTAGIDIGDFSTGPRVMIRPGGACPLENVAQAIQQNRNPPYIQVNIEDQPWAAAMDPEQCQHWERELTPDFPFSDPYLALYHAALLQTGEPRLDRVVSAHLSTLKPPRRGDPVVRLQTAPGKQMQVDWAFSFLIFSLHALLA